MLSKWHIIIKKRDWSDTLATITIGPSGGISMISDIMLSNFSYFIWVAMEKQSIVYVRNTGQGLKKGYGQRCSTTKDDKFTHTTKPIVRFL